MADNTVLSSGQARHRVRHTDVMSPTKDQLEDRVESDTRSHVGTRPLSGGPDGSTGLSHKLSQQWWQTKRSHRV